MNQQVKPLAILQTIPNNVLSKEVKIYNANISQLKFKDFKKKDKAAIVEELMKWRIYFGIVEDPSDIEYVINAEFIVENYPTLNITDLEVAKNLASSGELGIKQNIADNSFAKFSPSYIGIILSNYISYKKEVIFKVKQEVEKQNKVEQIEPSDIEKVENFKKKLVLAFTETLKGNEYYDFGDTTYYFITNNNLIEITTNLLKEAKRIGKQKAQAEIYKKTISSVLKSTSIDTTNKDALENKHARQFIVTQWLQKMVDFSNKRKSKLELEKLYETLNNFLDSITIEMINK
jgi:hypothetical protein